MSKSYGNSILLSEDADRVAEKIKNSVTDRPKLTDRGSPDRCPVGNLHQIFSDPATLAYITQGCTHATITCVECKELAVKGVNAHLDPIRERRRQLAQQPERLKEIIQQGDQKARRVAEDTMQAAREAVGTLATTSVTEIAKQDTAASASAWKVPEAARQAGSEQERHDILVNDWVEKISLTYPLRKDRPRTFITLRGRKVGVHAARCDQSGEWEFSFQDRPLNVMVLLAEDGSCYEDYVLPPKVLQTYWKQFGREKGEHGDTVRIRTRRDANHEMFIRLEANNLAIQNYKGNHSALE